MTETSGTTDDAQRETDDRLDEAAELLEEYAEDVDTAGARHAATVAGNLRGGTGRLWIQEVQERNHQWREENVPNAEPLDQAAHTAVEASELLDLFVKQAEYGVGLDAVEAKTEAGDIVVSHLSLMSMMGWDVVDCIDLARSKNDGREWYGEDE